MSYAAAVARAYGIRACVVTGAPSLLHIEALQQLESRVPLLVRGSCSPRLCGRAVHKAARATPARVTAPGRVIPDWLLAAAAASEDADLSVFRGHEVHRVASNATLTFEHTYTWWGEILPCLQSLPSVHTTNNPSSLSLCPAPGAVALMLSSCVTAGTLLQAASVGIVTAMPCTSQAVTQYACMAAASSLLHLNPSAPRCAQGLRWGGLKGTLMHVA